MNWLEFPVAVWLSSVYFQSQGNNIFTCHASGASGLKTEPAEPGGGACVRLRCSLMLSALWFGCVVTETFGYGSSSASAPTLARSGSSYAGTAGSRVVASPGCGRITLEEVDDVDWSGGVHSCSREGAQVVWQQEYMTQLELDASLLRSRRSAAVSCPGLIAHGKGLGSHCKGFTKLESEVMAEDLSGVFPEDRWKVGSADDDGADVYVGHERCCDRSWRCDWRGRSRALARVLEGARTQSSCAGTDEHPIVARCRRTTTCDMC